MKNDLLENLIMVGVLTGTIPFLASALLIGMVGVLLG